MDRLGWPLERFNCENSVARYEAITPDAVAELTWDTSWIIANFYRPRLRR